MMLFIKPKTRDKNVFSSWKDLVLGVPQESVLKPLDFRIYLYGLFFFLSMLAYRILLMIPLLIFVTKIWRIFEIN